MTISISLYVVVEVKPDSSVNKLSVKSAAKLLGISSTLGDSLMVYVYTSATLGDGNLILTLILFIYTQTLF